MPVCLNVRKETKLKFSLPDHLNLERLFTGDQGLIFECSAIGEEGDQINFNCLYMCIHIFSCIFIHSYMCRSHVSGWKNCL